MLSVGGVVLGVSNPSVRQQYNPKVMLPVSLSELQAYDFTSTRKILFCVIVSYCCFFRVFDWIHHNVFIHNNDIGCYQFAAGMGRWAFLPCKVLWQTDAYGDWQQDGKAGWSDKIYCSSFREVNVVLSCLVVLFCLIRGCDMKTVYKSIGLHDSLTLISSVFFGKSALEIEKPLKLSLSVKLENPIKAIFNLWQMSQSLFRIDSPALDIGCWHI